MKTTQGNMLASLVNARRAVEEEQATLGPFIGPASLRKLDDSIAELSVTVEHQNLYTRDMRGAFATQRAARITLVRDHMTPIAYIAKVELATTPEFVKFEMPDAHVSVRILASHAVGMAEAARPYSKIFIEAGRQPDFIDRLKTAAGAMLAAASDGASNRSKRKQSTSNLRQKLTRAREVVNMLDSFVKEAAAGDKTFLDRWQSAKRVRHGTSAHGQGSTAGTATAGTTTTATPTHGGAA